MPSLIDAIREHHKAVAGTDPLHVKAATIKTPTIDREQRLVKGLVSVAVPDMDNEVVVPEGLDMAYFPGAVKAVYLNHDYTQLPVGTCRSLTCRDGEMFAVTHITSRAIGDDLLTAIDEGAINGFSVGFKAMEWGPPTPEEIKRYGQCESVVRKGMLMEYSITAMPCNPAALMNLVSKSMIHRSSAVAFGLPDEPRKPVKGRTLVVAGGVVLKR